MLNAQGVFVPIPAPFTDDGSQLSEIRLARVLKLALSSGAAGIMVGGEVSECLTLSHAERKQLLELASRSVPPGTPTLAYVGSPSTLASIDLAQHAAQCGVRAAVIECPSGPYTDQECIDHIHRVAQYGHATIIVLESGAARSAVIEAAGSMTGVHIGVGLSRSGWSSWASGTSAMSDEFCCGELGVMPMALLACARPGGFGTETSAALKGMIAEYGLARLVKTDEECLGMDLGPLRGPLQAMPQEAVSRLRRLMAVAA